MVSLRSKLIGISSAILLTILSATSTYGNQKYECTEENYLGRTSSEHNLMYIVKKGDTLSKIAEIHCTTSEKLGKLNGLKNIHLIRPGQEIKTPKRNPSNYEK